MSAEQVEQLEALQRARAETRPAVLYLKGDDGTREARAVRLGIRGDRFTEGASGDLAIGERVLGARRRKVLTKALVEATVLGGILGMAFGMGETGPAANLGDFPVLISPWTPAGAVAIAIFIAIFFGYYPTRRASKLDPIEALRFE